MKRNRLSLGQYELCRIKVPANVGEYILGKAPELGRCEARKVYDGLRAERNLSADWQTSQRLQYLSELFWVVGSHTPVFVSEVGEEEAVPTNYLERDVHSFGFNKVQPCKVLSLRVSWPVCGQQLYRDMEAIVERKMRSFKTDFYFHDMMTLSREAYRHPLLWTVGGSHTFMEVHDAEADARCWASSMEKDGDRVRRFLNGEDDTWMGAALRVSCSEDDLYYYHDGAMLHEVSRDTFRSIHERHVERVRHQVEGMLKLEAA